VLFDVEDEAGRPGWASYDGTVVEHIPAAANQPAGWKVLYDDGDEIADGNGEMKWLDPQS
jgi:hypothetical protein